MRSNFKREAIAGITTFFTLSYIIIVNPSILSSSGTGMSFSGVLTATVLLSFFMTLMMGVYAKLPFAVAPGMGINAFFTYSLILGQKIPWETALGMVFWSGVLFLLISATPIREKIATAIPLHLRLATSAGIGFFLSFIGLKNADFIAADPVTFVKLGPLNEKTWLALIALMLMLYLSRKKNPFAFLSGIALVTLGAFLIHPPVLPEIVFSAPDFHSVFFKLDFLDALKPALLPAIISILFTDLFDSVSTFVGISQANGLVDEKGDPKNLKQGLIVDSFATLFAGVLGTSSGTAYIESGAGIEAGGRTGMTSVVTAFCFLPFLFVSPLLSLVPTFATAPVLIFLGAMMFKSVLEIKLKGLEDLLPAFLTLILIPLTFSITQGILWGLFSHLIFYALVGRRKELPMATVGVCVLAGILLYLETHI